MDNSKHMIHLDLPNNPVLRRLTLRSIARNRERIERICALSDGLERQILSLAVKVEMETGYYSGVAEFCRHPAYQQIVQIGWSAVPYLIREMGLEDHRWCMALTAITGENPIREEHRGKVDLMSQDWLEWGIQKGLISSVSAG